jgi:predicted membrane-bound dolichyl-phosphate-mannose-protein mannosyltransferase
MLTEHVGWLKFPKSYASQEFETWYWLYNTLPNKTKYSFYVTKIIPTATDLLFGNESIHLKTKFMDDYAVGFKKVKSECCVCVLNMHTKCVC